MLRVSRLTSFGSAFVAALLLTARGDALAASAAQCPLAAPQTIAAGLAVAGASAALEPGGTSVGSQSAGAFDPQADIARREAERGQFERLLAARPLLPAQTALQLAITPEQRAGIEQDVPGNGREKVGEALDVGQTVDFSAVDARALASGTIDVANGIAARNGAAGVTWAIELSSPDATALRLRFEDVELAPGVSLHVYNELGRVAGPYTGRGPDGDGAFWSASVFGSRVVVQLLADDADALRASHFTVSKAMHFGSRFRIADSIRPRYAVGPSPDSVDFCGTQVPNCTVDGMCALQSNQGLANAINAVAHLQFVDGASAYICTGTLLNTSLAGSAAPKPYLLTANHCIHSQPSASSLEAYFRYHTAFCNGACTWTLTQVNGSSLMVTGAAPTYADFTLLRLSPIPSGSGLMLAGWASGALVEGAYLLRLSHPEGAPLAYSLRRLRKNNVNLTHCAGAAEPIFMYSGLAMQSSDAAGAVAGGSSGSAAIVLNDNASDVYVVGQLTGDCPAGGDTCNANTDATVDGAFSASFPYLRRFLVDRIFASGFE